MLKELMNLSNRNFIKSNRLIIPIIAIFSFIGIAYSVGPQKILPSLMIQAIFVFFLMVIIAVSYCDVENEVLQQILSLKLRPDKKYYLYISKILVLAKILLVISLIQAAYPILRYYLRFNTLFDRRPVLSDGILSFLVAFLFGYLGMMIGLILNPQRIRERKLQISVVILVAILAIVQINIAEDITVLRYVLWILPPLGKISNVINNHEYFTIDSIWVLLQGLAYCVIYTVFYLVEMLWSERFTKVRRISYNKH